jgi:hypothetical protein
MGMNGGAEDSTAEPTPPTFCAYCDAPDPTNFCSLVNGGQVLQRGVRAPGLEKRTVERVAPDLVLSRLRARHQREVQARGRGGEREV